ncbi:hypothetical protein [Halobacteriaceae bacterium SHR40]|uniref:hypothetical protein n=1 Tax=Halovenus amylolytica TaxID=2500550 RepID=UPI000FE30717
MEHELRWRLDLIIGLVVFVALCAATIVVTTVAYGILWVILFAVLLWIAFSQIDSLQQYTGWHRKKSP